MIATYLYHQEEYQPTIGERAKRPHWYMIHVFRCVDCGRETIYRERVYGEKPQAYSETHEVIEERCSYCEMS